VVTASEAIDIESIGGKMVESLNLLLSLSFPGGGSVFRPFGRKSKNVKMKDLTPFLHSM